MDQRILVISILFLIKFIFGFWLYRKGKPYNTWLLTVHKLASLATLAYIVLTVYETYQIGGSNTMGIVSMSLTGILFAIAIVTGGVLSIDKPAPAVILILHKVTPFLTILSMTATIVFVF